MEKSADSLLMLLPNLRFHIQIIELLHPNYIKYPCF